MHQWGSGNLSRCQWSALSTSREFDSRLMQSFREFSSRYHCSPVVFSSSILKSFLIELCPLMQD